VAIISMIICHPVIMLGAHHIGYENDIPYLVADLFFGDYLAAAHAFMFAMGVGTVYSSRRQPVNLIRRGIWIFVLGYILNFFRYGIYALAGGIIEGEFMEETLYALTAQDILQFAGLALIVTGILYYFRLKATHILVIAVVLSMIAEPLAFQFEGSYAANYFLGFFLVTTEDESCFVFMSWFLFVAIGRLFGTVIRKKKNLDSFYFRLFIIACPVMVLYIILTFIFGPFFLCREGWYYGVSLPETLGLLSIDMTLLSAFYFLLKKIDLSTVRPLITMSKNVNAIYVIHWCILGFIDSFVCYLLGFVIPYPAEYLIAIALIFVSYGIAKWWRKRRGKLYTLTYFTSLVPLKLYDLVHGTHYSGIRDTQDQGGRYAYFPSPVFSFPSLRRYIRRHLNGGRGHAVLDIGCGKGFMLQFFTKLGFDQISGIEYNERLCHLAEENLKHASRKAVVYQVDAVDFPMYAYYDIFYLYNPFDAMILEKVIDQILSTLKAHPRDLTVFYCNPVYGDYLKEKGFQIAGQFYYKTTVYVLCGE
jgi:hypothetical protein